jgi:sugar phosphate isomerase/epimerase
MSTPEQRLRWSYMDHWRADTPRGPVTQYHSRRQMDDFVKQIAAVGFEGLDMFDFQIFGLTDMFGSIEAYQRYLRDHGVEKIVNLFRGIMYDRRVADPHSRATHDEIVESTRRMLGMWSALEIENLIVMPAGLYIDVEPVTDDAIKAAAECWTRVGEMTRTEFGVTTTGHHEFFCAIRTERDIRKFYGWSDPRYVSFFCDTAQHCIAGVDPVALYEALHERCSGFHFKDSRQVDTTGAYAHRPDAELMAPQTDRWFHEMGTEGGLVDFPRLMAALKRHRFTGWVTVEHDKANIGGDYAESTALAMWYAQRVLAEVYA